MTTIRQIMKFCDIIAPFGLADDWDNVGLLVGDRRASVEKVLVALDVTPEVVEEARSIGAQLIISHHPVIFDSLRALTPDSAAYLLAKYDIAALCLHTNLDRAEQGVNVQLAKALGLKRIEFYPEEYLLVGDPQERMDADQYAAFIKERLGAPSVRYTGGKVTRVALSSGGGGEGILLADKYGFDAFITGEMKHHLFNHAVSRGIAAFDAGHFSTENVVVKPLTHLLSDKFFSVRFFISEQCVCPYQSV